MPSLKRILTAVLFSVVLLLVACGGDSTPATPTVEIIPIDTPVPIQIPTETSGGEDSNTVDGYPAPAVPEINTEAEGYPAPDAEQNALPERGYPEPEAEQGEGNADVVAVRAVESSDGSWTFYVTVAHPDTGWEDYADGWDVVTPEGQVLDPDLSTPFTRLLLHPHENEQPFERSQSGIVIPADVTQVTVRAHDIVDGFGGEEVVVDLTQAEGENYSVERP